MTCLRIHLFFTRESAFFLFVFFRIRSKKSSGKVKEYMLPSAVKLRKIEDVISFGPT